MGYGDFNLDLPDGENFEPSAERVEAFQAMLLTEPYNLSQPYTNREAWEKVKASPGGERMLKSAREELAEDPILYLTNDIYNYTIEKFNRDRINPVMPRQRNRIGVLPFAECLEPGGEFLAQFEKDVRAMEQLDKWNYPTNQDHFVDGFFPDLCATNIAANLSLALHMLPDRLSPEIQDLIPQLVQEQIFDPFEKVIKSGKGVYWWVTCNHNWNSVCMAEILHCALTLKSDLKERAWYCALAEKVLAYSESGFEESGFYTEGVSYWGYGFSHYILAAELIRGVTRGQIDWLKKPKVELMSQFGTRMEIQDGTYPAFADCKSSVQPPQWLCHWYNNRIDPKREERDTGREIDSFDPPHFIHGSINALLSFHQVDVNQAFAREIGQRERDWFEDVQFLISRPSADSPTRLAATFKGGHNGVNHNHNDLGTFTVLQKGKELLIDPGAEEYTTRTFSAKRYHGDLLNSFGHPVPVIGGDLQKPGKDDHRAGYGSEFYATVVETDFSDQRDYVKIDYTQAYRVDSLEKLIRSFEYVRGETESIEVVDTVSFKTPDTFETALITFAQWEEKEPGGFIFATEDAAVRLEIQTADGELEFSHTVIQESQTPDRLSWKFKEPISSATIRFKITPA